MSAASTTGQGRGWSPLVKCVVSLAIAGHLAAVVLPPLASPPPASLLANEAIQPFRPYVGLLYLWHGYRFFAPDPGPGHSLRWSLVNTRGEQLSGSLPDSANDWPRLLYHRRFMIAEKLAGMIPPVEAPVAIQREAKRRWGPLAQAVAAELLTRHEGVTVRLEMVEHYLPTPADVSDRRAGRPAAPGAWEDRSTPLGTYALVAPGSDRAGAASGGARP